MIKEATETSTGKKDGTCTACGLTKMAAIPILAHTTHTWATDWSKDDTYHWHDCTSNRCNEVKDKNAHSWGSGVVTKPAPTRS